MYAIIENGGRQYKVSEGDVIDIDLVKAEADSEITFDKVKMLDADGDVKVGTPDVSGATVTASVVGEIKTDKVLGTSFRRRHGSKVTKGHRQRYTQVKITGIKG
ncbi:MAG: 50S ribosomal protein L21 [Planctomycetota bacterium]|jgi:large subunit ribosomal protein L21